MGGMGGGSGGGQTTVEVMVPGNKVGLVIGKGGKTIRQLQVGCRLAWVKWLSVVNNEKRDVVSLINFFFLYFKRRGGVKMEMIQDDNIPSAHVKPLRISGDPQKCQRAKEMVMELLSEGEMKVV